MRAPVIAVTGPIASGKTTVARAVAGRRGAFVDCDALAHGALDDPAVRRRLIAAFGRRILTPSGRVSRPRLARAAFADARALARLNRIVRPRVRAIIEDAVRRARKEGRAEYIVLDAVLFFQYTFSFGVDLSIAAHADAETRIRRITARDGITRAEARRIVERQKPLEGGWRKANAVIDTGAPVAAVRREARRIRDEFLVRCARAPAGRAKTAARRSAGARRGAGPLPRGRRRAR